MADFIRQTPAGDTHERMVCRDCGHIAYENPKVITGAVVAHAGRVMLCRRAIEPRRGFWTLPAGYLELHETVEEGARREAAEEACADIVLDGMLAVFSISRINQVQIFFRARFADARPSFSPGEESLAVELFAWEAIPWAELAFPSVAWALRTWHDGAGAPLGAPSGNPQEDPRGTAGLE